MNDYVVKVAFDDGSTEKKVVQGEKHNRETIQRIVKEFEDKYPDKELVSMEVVES